MNARELLLEDSDATLLHLALLELGHTIQPSDKPILGREAALAHLRECGNCQADLLRLIKTFGKLVLSQTPPAMQAPGHPKNERCN